MTKNVINFSTNYINLQKILDGDNTQILGITGGGQTLNVTKKHFYEFLKKIVEISNKHTKIPVVYISMAFGNPYGEFWSKELVFEWINKIAALGVVEFSLADTTGEANNAQALADKQIQIAQLNQQTELAKLEARAESLREGLEHNGTAAIVQAKDAEINRLVNVINSLTKIKTK
jgi:hypothetical protein